MKKMKKCISLILAAILCFSSAMGSMITTQAAGSASDSVIRLTPGEAQTFNDTNGDGLGEFEGWGTSLCWWANRIGYSDSLTKQAAKYFFSDEGLDMNIGRYNVGGGDKTSANVDIVEVPINEKAQFYGISDATYTGTQMKETELNEFANSEFVVADADFGFTKGYTVGTISYIGWINEVGTADDTTASGGNLHFNNVEVEEAGNYTIKILLTLSGTNGRNVAIRVNDNPKDYIVDAATINANEIASSSNNKLFLVTIPDVQLNEGVNKIDLGGSGDWTLDFVKMAVIHSDDLGVLPEADEFLHKEHIIRSDSGVPGYATDVTRMDLENKSLEEYAAEYDAVDEESGYAWNYDWDADANQINILKAAIAASGEFHAEAFSNSPPYFMTVSGCSSGHTSSGTDNLREDCYTAFATYMADVIEHWNNEGIIKFASASPMNEPDTTYWGAYSNKQEGCHFDPGTSQSTIIVALDKALKERGIDLIMVGTDETSIDTQIDSYKALSTEAKSVVERIDTHTYGGSKRAELKEVAQEAEKNLWMSEVDGAFTGGTNAGEMSAALGLASRMMTDLNGLQSTAWILWNAIDMHADSSEYGMKWVNKGSANDYASVEALYDAWMPSETAGYWGFAAADHDNEEILLTMKYYGYGQLSRYIRPGMTLIGTSSTGNTLAAYDSENNKVVVVAMNTSASDQTWSFDLSLFNEVESDAKVTAIRTSGNMESGEKWADVSKNVNSDVDAKTKTVTADMKANSITTFIIEGVTYNPENPVVDNTIEVEITKDMISGSTPWNGDTSHDVDKLIDGNLSSFFDGVEDGYVIINLGEVKDIASIAYAPRSGYEYRCQGAVISGSNDGEIWEELYTITNAPASGTLSYVYAGEFASGTTEYQYIKYAVPNKDDGDGNCNVAEIKIFTTVPAIESVKDISAVIYEGKEPKLPTKVEGTATTGEKYELPVTWNLGSVDFDSMKLFDSVEVSGILTGTSLSAKATIVMIPENLEYLIDCHNPNSSVWKVASESVETLLNTEAPDQQKTDENIWGYTFSVGKNDSDDTDSWDYDMGNPLYGYGYWARKNKNITYQVTLPKGEHIVNLGGFDFWNGRTMDVKYSINGGEKQDLCELTLNHNYGTYASGIIKVEEDNSVVTISVERGSQDPILGFISINKYINEEDTKIQFTEEEIAANDNVLYLVNSGTPDASVVPEGYILGLYQSNVDQQYTADAKTGLSWGYEPNDKNSKIVNGGSDATTITGSYIYMADSGVTFVKDVSGFKYKFELPERANQDYIVTVGFQNPWDPRNVDIKLEGETVEADLNIPKATLVEKEYKVEVTDGELNVMVHAPKRTSQYGDPVLSYIIVEAVPTYTVEVLQSVVTSYKEKTEGHTYTDETKEVFDEAIKYAESVLKAETSDHTEIKEAIEKIENAYAALKEIFTYDSITGTNGAQLFDNNGNKIQAHGGQIQKWGDTYYWYGEDKTNGYRPVVGVHLYTSKDLYNWTDEGVVLRSIPVSEEDYEKDQTAGYKADLSIFEEDEYFKSLYGDYTGMKPDDTANYDSKLEEVYWNLAEDRSVIERPKVLYNEATGKYIMWYHADGRTPTSDADYGKARAGVAISDSPTGPFKLLGTYILATGTTNHEWDDVGGHVRDMNVFCDDDGTAYVLYSSEGNTTMYIAELNDEYTGLVKDAEDMVYGEDFTIISTDSREAPALFKYDGTYYLITSGCTGWAPNQARYTVATDLMGPWTVMGDPCVGDTAGTTFSTQSTCVFPVDAEAGKYIYMGDRWFNPDTGGDLSDSRYVWLPVEFGEGQTLSLKSYADWTLDELEGKGKIEIKTELPQNVGSITELKEKLPETLNITVGGTVYENTPVTWTVDAVKEALGDNALGNVTVKGTLTELGREFSKTVFVYNNKLQYLIDCSTGENGVVSGSETYNKFAVYADLQNKVSDQKYTEESGWGYTSVTDKENSASYDMGSKGSADFYNCGWWAASNDSMDYTLTLEPGNYVLATGYQEWWNTRRNIKVTVSSVDAEGNTTEIGYTEFRLASTEQALQINTDITVPEGSQKVLISVTKTSGSDAVLSWIGVIGEELNLPPVDKSELQEVIDLSEQLNKEDYTDSSWEKFQAALDNVIKVKNNENATQEEVDEALLALIEALRQLEERPDEPQKPSDNDNKEDSKSDGIATGDESPIIMYVGFGIIALIAVFVVLKNKKKV